ncbi:hypothetical protein CKM354_001229600 [Cercospora kikuchii]|uniref:F-box domain-containing protein n=1 Tax=Cercospora kikuchii TaxID=84275 RepID=A0A9P3FLR0_9PEZI|nr:uncharacterized protein CKM354_001229600 [Cercospora kikuchii]GIZ49264.1 hypothetical protein CKM354_001229600 [Cercospora kikuchii]
MAGKKFSNKRARMLAFISKIYPRGTRRITKGNTDTRVVSPAETAVLQTAELLESILSHLPGDNVPTTRLVCQQWNELITTSPTLRERILLDRLWYIPYGPYPTPNHIPPVFRLAPTSSNMIVSRSNPSGQVPPQVPNSSGMIVLRPALLHHLFYKDSGDRADWHFAIGDTMKVRLNLDLKDILSQGTMHTERYAKALITNPPCYNALMTLHWSAYHVERNEILIGEVSSVLDDPCGLTVKHILDVLFQKRGSCSLREWHGRLSDCITPFGEQDRADDWTFSEIFEQLIEDGYQNVAIKNCYLGLYGIVVPRQSQLESLRLEKDMGEFLKEVEMKG